ncbi:MAG: hypothetical protein M3Z29_08515, partial [Pseudomonadota bacterium]|nr:hypothetical protein [Pseudomonadota bacterium]
LALVRGSPASSSRAERAIVILQAQSLLDRGDPARAAAMLRPYAGEGSRPPLLLGAQIALAAAQPAGTDSAPLRAHVAELQTWVAVHPDDSLAWTVLGQSWSRLGMPLRSLRAEAEARFALGDLVGAADRLRAGQRLVRTGGSTDFIDASVIDSRLRVVETQRKQIEAEQRASR